MAGVEEFVAGLPKAELHVHHVGSASPRIVAELAARHPDTAAARTVPHDPDELARYFVFEDFPHFIRTYLTVVDLVRTADDVRLLTYEVARDMAAQQIRYAELTVTPTCRSVTTCRCRPSWRRSRTPARAPSVTSASSSPGSSTSPPTSGCPPPS